MESGAIHSQKSHPCPSEIALHRNELCEDAVSRRDGASVRVQKRSPATGYEQYRVGLIVIVISDSNLC